MSDRLALANAIVDAGIERGKAERVASVIVDLIHDSVATKADMQASEAAIRGELRAEIGSVRALVAGETARLDTRIERLDAKVELVAHRITRQLASLIVVMTGIILAVLRFLPPPHG